MQSELTQSMQAEIDRLQRLVKHKDREITRLGNIINYRAVENDIIPLSIECVIHHVCMFYNITVKQLIDKNRSHERIVSRMAVCWIANRRYKHTFKSIGVKLNHRDHSTIMNACDKADEFMQTNKAFNQHVKMIINTIETEFTQPYNES